MLHLEALWERFLDRLKGDFRPDILGDETERESSLRDHVEHTEIESEPIRELASSFSLKYLAPNPR